MDLSETRENLPALTEALAAEGHEVHAISAATGEGVSDLMKRTLELLRDIPEVKPAVPQERRVYTMESTREDYWEAVRLSRHHFEVRGPKIERMTRMTDFKNEEAADRFQRILEASGISAKLEEIGINAGDTVHVAGEELIWDEAAVMAERFESNRRKRRTKRERLLKHYGIEPESNDLL
jgi:GTP-binding protein